MSLSSLWLLPLSYLASIPRPLLFFFLTYVCIHPFRLRRHVLTKSRCDSVSAFCVCFSFLYIAHWRKGGDTIMLSIQSGYVVVRFCAQGWKAQVCPAAASRCFSSVCLACAYV